MRRIVNLLVYDSDQATLVHAWSNGYPPDHPRRRDKRLYRTGAGRWFMHQLGGPETDYGRRSAGRRVGGEQLEPMSEDDVVAFLDSHEGQEALACWFGDVLRPA